MIPMTDRSIVDNGGHEKVLLMCIKGDIEGIMKRTRTTGKRNRIIRRAIDILMGLSIKGYEGRSVGAIYLIGDIQGVRKNSAQMIINPFKGWRDINIEDHKQLPTLESFSQLDGAIIIDNRGFVHYAGRMINVKDETPANEHKDFKKKKGKGSGTRWRAAKFITSRTKTIAVTLSSSGNITIFRNGEQVGILERRLCSMELKDVPVYLFPE